MMTEAVRMIISTDIAPDLGKLDKEPGMARRRVHACDAQSLADNALASQADWLTILAVVLRW